jgi:hypothetical protein
VPPSPPPFGSGGGAHSLAREGVGDSQFRRGDIHCGTLYTYIMFFVVPEAGSLKMNTALEYSTRGVQEGGRRCKKSTLNDLVHLTPLRIPLMNPPLVYKE